MFYKLVRVKYNKLFSSNTFEEGHMVEYKVGEWVRPIIPNSLLFVFDNLNEVLAYKNRELNDCAIYICDVESPVKLMNRCNPWFEERFYDFWNDKSFVKTPDNPRFTFYGVKAVKLLEKVG